MLCEVSKNMLKEGVKLEPSLSCDSHKIVLAQVTFQFLGLKQIFYLVPIHGYFK